MFKAYKLYIEAIHFEFEQEKIYHEVFCIKGFVKYIPRAVVIYNNYNKYLFIINYIFFIPLWALWAIFINPCFLLLAAVKWGLSVIKVNKIEMPLNLYLSLSDIKFFSYIDKSENDYPDAVLNFSFHNAQSKFNTTLSVINFFQITDYVKMIKALIIAFFTPFILLFSSKRYLMLFSYSAFYWYWTYFTLKDKKFNSIWISNHYDRWLKLIDFLPNVNRKVMVQHGQMEYVAIDTGKIYFPEFTKKIKNVSIVFLIDENSKRFFIDMMDQNVDVSFKLLKSKLDVISWPKSFQSKFKILILGHQNDFNFHQELINKLNKSENYDLAYKTHPQQSVEMKLLNTWLVSNSNELPKSDIVISYGSSLDTEIKQLLPSTIILNYAFNDKFKTEDAIYSIESQLKNYA
jgi:hypothetical protein